MDSGRLIVDPPASGAWNMAVDEALLEAAERDRECTLRFYQWCEPTLSLGYFQRYAERDSHSDSRLCPLVRRSTGGGAILHDRELTYSFVFPVTKGIDANAPQLYQAFHRTLVQVLAAEFRVSASLFESKKLAEPQAMAFLCFQRRAKGDVVIGNRKIAGSAQRRRRGAILQHGSVLLGASESASELLGIKEIAGVDLQPVDIVTPWVSAIRNELKMLWRDSQLSDREISATREIERRRFAAPEWTKKR